MLTQCISPQLAASSVIDDRSVTLSSLCETFSRHTEGKASRLPASDEASPSPFDACRAEDVLNRMFSHSNQHPESASGKMARLFQHSISCRNAGAHRADHQMLVTRLAFEMHELEQQRFASCASSPMHSGDQETPLQAYNRIISSAKLMKEIVGHDWQTFADTASLGASLPLPWERPEALPL